MRPLTRNNQQGTPPHRLDLFLCTLGAILIVGSTIFLASMGWSIQLVAAEQSPTLKTQAPSLLDRRTKKFDYDIPTPGSYQLPRIRSAIDATVLGEDFKAIQLHDLMRDRITVLSFDHSLGQSNGDCKIKSGPLFEVQRITREFPELADDLLILTIRARSFEISDQRQTVEKITLGHGRGAKWTFLRAHAKTDQEQLFHTYRQRAAAAGETNRECHSSNPVFLIGKDLTVRNSYPYDALDPRLVAADALTLLRAEKE